MYVLLLGCLTVYSLKSIEQQQLVVMGVKWAFPATNLLLLFFFFFSFPACISFPAENEAA